MHHSLGLVKFYFCSRKGNKGNFFFNPFISCKAVKRKLLLNVRQYEKHITLKREDNRNTKIIIEASHRH